MHVDINQVLSPEIFTQARIACYFLVRVWVAERTSDAKDGTFYGVGFCQQH